MPLFHHNDTHSGAKMTKKKKFFIFLIAFIALIKLDFYVADKVDKEMYATLLANIDERVASAELDFDGPRRQGCMIGRIYVIYAYQTCFFRSYGPVLGLRPSFEYRYHGPVAASLLFNKTEDSLYFIESYLGRPLRTIYVSGDGE
jgi:hypothetical protein